MQNSYSNVQSIYKDSILQVNIPQALKSFMFGHGSSPELFSKIDDVSSVVLIAIYSNDEMIYVYDPNTEDFAIFIQANNQWGVINNCPTLSKRLSMTKTNDLTTYFNANKEYISIIHKEANKSFLNKVIKDCNNAISNLDRKLESIKSQKQIAMNMLLEIDGLEVM